MLNIILLSGGSGKRLWPLSNDTMSKQFLRLLTNDKGKKESMVQRVFRQIDEAGLKANITIATNKNQEDLITKQLGNVDMVLEPERRNTFPAIVLACSYIYSNSKASLDDSVIVIPVDPYAENSYFTTLAKIDEEIQKENSEIVLMGIKPTYPSEKYGYIVCGNGSDRKVKSFKEKPSLEDAKKLLKEGAFWNGGVFGFKLKYILNIAQKYVSNTKYENVVNSYSKLPSISFDYEVVEKASNISMVEYSGYWKDLGTWNTLTEEIEETHGNVILGEGCENVSVVNVSDKPIVALGLKDTVIAASADGIFVSNKEKSSYNKSYVEKISTRPMYQDKRWGTYTVLFSDTLSDNSKCLTKHLFINKGKELSYQLHHHRNEIWNIIDGKGKLTLDEKTIDINKGDVIQIKKNTKHKVVATDDLHIIEVQIGDKVDEEDIERLD